MDRFLDLSRDFVGSANMRQRQSNGLAIQLAYLVFDDDVPAECFGNEAVFANGDLTGLITGGAYGYRVGKSLAFAYLKPEHCNAGQALTVETSIGTRHCHVELDAAYNPNNSLLRS
jgi:dimethylglycine dehydrogenase